MMVKTIRNILKYASTLCCGFLVLASSCARDPLTADDDNTPNGKVRVEMAFNYVSDKQPVSSKASLTADDEDALDVDAVWVLVLDDHNIETERILKQAPVKAQMIESKKVFANLNPEASDSWVYIVANVPDDASAYLQGLAAGETLGSIMQNPAMKLTPATRSGLTHPFPMWGTTGTKLSEIRKGVEVPEVVNLMRAVARIDVVVAADILPAKFAIKKVSVVNAAKNGWLFQPTPIAAQSLTDVIKYDPAGEVSGDNSIVNQIYCYENNGLIDGTIKNVTRVVIEGQYEGKTSPSFYGIDIAYKPLPGDVEKYDIERNKVYTVRITKIDKDGYSTFDLAEKSESFNSGIVSDVTVTDPYSHNIVSNGKQYMGTTNTHLLVYPKNDADIKNVLAATISYTCADGWPRGTMTASPGITFTTSGNSTEALEVGTGLTPIIRDVLINVAKDVTAGTIEVRIGNLSQVIKVSNRRIASSGGDIIEYFTRGEKGAGAGTESDFVVAEIINPSAENAWFKVSDNASALDPSTLFDKVTNPMGKIYLHLAGNIAYQSNTATDRKAQAFVTSKNDEQRYRVHVEQSYIDVYSGAIPIRPYTYVGVFHRWNETAERLIRIEAQQNHDGIEHAIAMNSTWVASVVSGDFIMLSTEPSNEGAIQSQDPYGSSGETSWNADQLEALGQFAQGEGRKVVTGTIDATTPNVYFKVGLASRLASFDAEPRYGLIALTYKSGNSTSSSTQFIYVRQGEAADYLMRPSDPVIYTSAYLWNNFTGTAATNPVALNNAKEPMPTRPLARKVAPYNLRANADGLVGLQEDIAITEHNFVDYPSKGGDYYFAFKNRFIRKANATYSPSMTASHWVASESENCPYGYRRISDTPDPSIKINRADIKVSGSENRQSYWLFPMKNMWLSNFSNQIRGYLADGYFDRRKIVANIRSDAGIIGKSHDHAVVRGGTTGLDDPNIEHAYWGFLVFNPYNYASVFMPLTGRYNYPNKPTKYNEEGSIGGNWTKSKWTSGTSGATNEANTYWLTNYGYTASEEIASNNVEVFDNYKSSGSFDAYSVRCIKDDGEAIVGPTDDKVTITRFDSGNGSELYSVRIQYDNTGGSLVTQLTAALSGGQLPKVNTLTVICLTSNALTAADYIYLNLLADSSPTLGSTNSLHHILIRGVGNHTIPAGAFTSAYWRSITIVQAKNIADGAFALPADSKLYNLWIGHFDDQLSVRSAAFGGAFDTKTVNLKIRGWALTQADRTETPPTWLGREWKTITEYK